MPSTGLAFDGFGRLILRKQCLSAAGTSPYLGAEVPGFKALGLQPDRIYQLFRDPVELRKAAPTFNSVELLLQHDDGFGVDYPRAWNIGWVDDVIFDGMHLRGTVVVGRPDAIRSIEIGARRQWSADYFYKADMTPGTFNGRHADGVMRDIRGRHVALVKDGRVPEATVDDDGVDYDACYSIQNPVRHSLPFQGATK
jgi:hypothetical protein